MTSLQETSDSRLIGRIPVRNIWLLLLYASQLYKELPESERVALEDASDDIPELVAEILTNAVERRLRRNLSHGYQRREADLNRVRGHINVLRTERLKLLQRARVACVYDELTVDTPRNRYVKAALLHLASFVRKDESARRCRELAARLERAGVSTDLQAGKRGSHALRDNVGWVDAAERRMLAAARLVFDLSIPTEESGSALLQIADRSASPGWKLYEQAVGGFYDAVLTPHDWNIKTGGHIGWPLLDPTSRLRAIMPGMITDIVLERRDIQNPTEGQRIVIDTKFMSIITGAWRREQSLRSGNIYQIYAYLRSQERDDDPLSGHSTGVLLYPAIDDSVDESATIQGHRIRFATVDLNADGKTIRSQLLRIVPGFSEGVAS